MGETQIRRLVDGDRVGVGHPFFVVHDDALDSASADFGRGSGEVREGDRLGQRQVDRALKWFDHLLKRIPPGQIGVSVRDPSRATHLADQGARVRQGFSSRSIAAPSSCWPCAKPERIPRQPCRSGARRRRIGPRLHSRRLPITCPRQCSRPQTRGRPPRADNDRRTAFQLGGICRSSSVPD